MTRIGSPPSRSGQRAMSPAIRQAADEFKIPVYYRNRDDVRHHGVLPLTGLSSDVKQTIYSRSDFTPEAETPVDLKASYTAKCGYPNEAAPRVFVKYFFVNTATGEKSGEMMQAVRLG